MDEGTERQMVDGEDGKTVEQPVEEAPEAETPGETPDGEEPEAED